MKKWNLLTYKFDISRRLSRSLHCLSLSIRRNISFIIYLVSIILLEIPSLSISNETREADVCSSIPKRKQTISGVEIKRGADVGKTLATKVIDGRKKEEECVLADLCAAPKLFAQTKKSSRRPWYLWTERTLDNMRCRVANNREHVSTRLSCTDIIIDSVTEGTVLNVMARFQSVTSRASSFAEKEKGYTSWYAIVFIRLLKFDG